MTSAFSRAAQAFRAIAFGGVVWCMLPASAAPFDEAPTAPASPGEAAAPSPDMRPARRGGVGAQGADGPGAVALDAGPGLHYAVYIAVLLSLLVLVLITWNRILRRRVNAKTVELARSSEVQRQARQAADRARDQLVATLGAIPDLLLEVGPDGRCLDVRATLTHPLMVPAEAWRGSMLDAVLPPDAAKACMQAVHEANEKGWSGGRLIELPRAAGTMWCELSVAKKPAPDGQAATFIMVSRDVTDRRNAEAGAQRLTRLYAALSQCNEAIVRCTDQTELLQQICDAAVTFGEMRMVWIGMLDPSGRLLTPVAVFGSGTAYIEGLQIVSDANDPRGRGPTGTALREDRPCWCQDYASDPATGPWRERGRSFGWAASAALPLHREGKVIGTISLYAGEVNAFDEQARNLLLKMAMNIDFALDRFREDAERARMAEAIAESETRMRELAESINDVIWTIDPETGRYLYVSPSVHRLRGYTAEEVMARSVEASLMPASAERVRELIADRLPDFLAGCHASEDFTIEALEQPCKDGSTVWTEIVASMVRNSKTGKVEIRGVTRNITERRSAEARIEHLAHHDQLTGLPNRVLLKDRFVHALHLAQRSEGRLALMFIDLDHFKNINDTLGHEIGDQLLIEVGKRLVAALRAGDTVARLGGDEFILILPDTDADGASRVAIKVVDEVARPWMADGHELRTTPSIGIAMYPDDGVDIDTLSRNADAAMYQVKRDTRNGFRFFTHEMQARSARTLLLASALHQALAGDQFTLLYQPQRSLRDGRIVGAEALLRWEHPELGAIAPSEFIPVAESNGLIIGIGEWVLRHAVTEARRWMDSGLPSLVIAVNLSAAQFSQPDLPERVTRIVDEVGLPAGQLELELTEAVAMNDPQTAVLMMDRLFARGIKLSIDDFGTGYSSLAYLKRFKVHRLKIDRSFVHDITDDPDDKAIVIAVINLAHSLGMYTIAEGVETAAQLDVLRQHGCDDAQGYLLSRPLAADDFAAFVRARCEVSCAL